MRLLFVCLGNICRSPTAEGVMRSLVVQAACRRACSWTPRARAAGTWAALRTGAQAQPRAARGIALGGSARQVGRDDFFDFDLLLAMDSSNLRDLRRLAPGEQEREKVRLLREFDPASAGRDDLDVPDPYYGAAGGFEEVLELVQAACEGLLEEIRARRVALMLPPGASGARPVGGGDINEAFRVLLADGREAFVKTRADPNPGEYAAEAAGLAWLAEPGALRTPRVLDLDEGYLALEWIEQRPSRPKRRGGARPWPGRHPRRGRPALRRSGRMRPCTAGHAAALERAGGRLAGVLRRAAAAAAGAKARERGALSPAASAAVGRVCERLAELAGPAEPPARLHGDLWSGNVMADLEGRPWLIDPSAYGGHREVDLAMLRLFGAPSERVFAAYQELTPLAAGWQERVELYQLLPLLVHAVLFGGLLLELRPSAWRCATRAGRARPGRVPRRPGRSEWRGVRPETLCARRRLYLLARAIVARHYRRGSTLAAVARALASSPRQLQRAYAQFGDVTFREDLMARRLAAAAELLVEQRSIPVRDVARIVGYRQAPHFARAFRRRYGLSPARFRQRALVAAEGSLPGDRPAPRAAGESLPAGERGSRPGERLPRAVGRLPQAPRASAPR